MCIFLRVYMSVCSCECGVCIMCAYAFVLYYKCFVCTCIVLCVCMCVLCVLYVYMHVCVHV